MGPTANQANLIEQIKEQTKQVHHVGKRTRKHASGKQEKTRRCMHKDADETQMILIQGNL